MKTPNTTKYFQITDDGKTLTSALLQKCKDKFPVWSYLDNDELDRQFPPPQEPTTRYFRKNIESDEEFKNMSADDLEKSGHVGITLRERIIMERIYFDETGKHLDIENWTLCSGSRDSDGGVPGAYWGDDGFRVDWGVRGAQDSSLRSREAVTLEPETSLPDIKIVHEYENPDTLPSFTCPHCDNPIGIYKISKK